MDTVKVTFEHLESGKKIVFTFSEDEINDPEKVSINIDFGEGGAKDHDGYPHIGLVNQFADALKIFGE